jgi:Fur family ferric uptake transcriptional regulator
LEKSCGLPRNTKQKNLILDCLKTSEKNHVTADEIIDVLKARGTPVAKSTVYRFLASLEESGDVRKYVIAEGSPACYQFIDKGGACVEHYHLMCKDCGGIVHFENAELQAILEKLSVDGPRTIFYGTCSNCVQFGEEQIL